MIEKSAEKAPRSNGRGRPKEEGCELKKRKPVGVAESIVQRRSVSELMSVMMEEYRESHATELAEYEDLQR